MTDDTGRAGNEQRASVTQAEERRTRKHRPVRAVLRWVVEGAHLARVLDEHRRRPCGEEVHDHRAVADRPQRRGRRDAAGERPTEGVEPVLACGVEQTVALRALAVTIDIRKVVPHPYQVWIALR